MSEELLNFIKFLQENELYENLKVKGSLNSNIPRVFTPETSTKDIIFDTEKDVNGWGNTDLVFNDLKNIINEDEQLNVIFNTGEVKAVDIKKSLVNLMKDKLYKNLEILGYTNLKNKKLIIKK